MYIQACQLALLALNSMFQYVTHAASVLQPHSPQCKHHTVCESEQQVDGCLTRHNMSCSRRQMTWGLVQPEKNRGNTPTSWRLCSTVSLLLQGFVCMCQSVCVCQRLVHGDTCVLLSCMEIHVHLPLTSQACAEEACGLVSVISTECVCSTESQKLNLGFRCLVRIIMLLTLIRQILYIGSILDYFM